MLGFQYDTALLEKFPTIYGGVIIAQNVQNQATPKALLADFLAEQQSTLTRIGDTPLAELPSLAAWRRTFSGFGVKPTQYRNAAEALLRRLTKKGDIPSINAFVDMGNLVSIRDGLPGAFFETRAVQGMVTVRLANGTERFTDLGSDAVVHPEIGEVIFADADDRVMARRWCWRQSDESASQLDTTQLLITVEGHHAEAKDDVQAALQDLQDLLTAYGGGSHSAALLAKDNPQLIV